MACRVGRISVKNLSHMSARTTSTWSPVGVGVLPVTMETQNVIPPRRKQCC